MKETLILASALALAVVASAAPESKASARTEVVDEALESPDAEGLCPFGRSLDEIHEDLPMIGGSFEIPIALCFWDTERLVYGHAFERVRGDAPHGRYYARFELRPDDHTPTFGGYRTELKDPYRGYIDDEMWYRFSVFIPEDYPTDTGDSMVIAQWHHWPARSPNLAFRYRTNEGQAPRLEITAQVGPLQVPDDPQDDDWMYGVRERLFTWDHIPRGVWHTFAIHAKWSWDPSLGFIEVWSKTTDEPEFIQLVDYQGTVGFVPDLFDPDEFTGRDLDLFWYLYDHDLGPMFKMGLYSWTQPQEDTIYVMHHDDYRRGVSAAAIGLPELDGALSRAP